MYTLFYFLNFPTTSWQISTYKSFFTRSLSSFIISSVITARKKELRMELWWTPTFTSSIFANILVCLYISVMAKTSLAITPFQSPPNHFSCDMMKHFFHISKNHIQFSSCCFKFFQHLLQYKNCILAFFSRHEPYLLFIYLYRVSQVLFKYLFNYFHAMLQQFYTFVTSTDLTSPFPL